MKKRMLTAYIAEQADFIALHPGCLLIAAADTDF